ncbi:SpoIIE family protein phosphatase [Actinokineospora bangkokensis]|uniref:SpoIIE family protein phosphatase n=1 Tax=Actinokineospora bangkokensis TaxID=1193682 RepID=UPI001E516961|nr:SpoIIE family protein phosphatase [Actinokineospora bangkokensis]
MATPEDGPVPDVFAADPRIGRDLVRVDWAATPLGAPDGWPQSLRTTVSILLSSRFPMWMAWGPELTFFCNDAYRRDTLGRKYPWALGRPAREVWAEIWGDIGPRVASVLDTGQATWDEALLLFLERSGYVEESYHTFSYSPLQDDEDQVVGMLCVVSEDTERVISERRMATLRDLGSDYSVLRSERQVLAFTDQQLGRNLRDLPFAATYLFDEAGTAVPTGSSGIGATRALTSDPGAWPVAEVQDGQSVLLDLDPDRFPDPPRGDWAEPAVRALVVPLRQQGAAPFGFLVAGLNRYRELDGAYRGFLELVAGHIATGIVSARSFQAQQRRAEELAALDRAKTTFFSNISHEFRTPLTLIMGPVAELRAREDTGLDQRARTELDVVHRNGLRLSKLVTTLLDFSRIEAGRMRASYAPTDLAAATADLASVFRSAVEAAGLRFTVDCAPLGEPVHLDQDMWEKIVFNLLSNALKFTFDGEVAVTARRDGAHAVVTVRDTGVGVPEAEMPRLFERFHRIENSRARSHEGSGIGLALVRELVDLHGGTITAESTEGAGTTFTIRLPFGTAHLPADATAPAERPARTGETGEQYVQEALRWLPGAGAEPEVPLGPDAPESGAPVRVLIADDNADMRDYLGRLLRGAGYQVEAVVDGLRALEAVRAEQPDLVVSDVMMPGLDGLALVGALRGDARTAAVPVLLLSARAGQEASIEGFRAGADDYLVKPFAAAELLARVRSTVELSRLRAHHARWRTALVDSLQEAFFVCDEDGAVIEINSAFTDILGYGPEGLPYRPTHPWWPDPDTDPEQHDEVADAFALLMAAEHGSYTIPVTHRDGHRLWVTASFNDAEDPDTGRRITVGTFRDTTAEHYAVQRQGALAALNSQLAQADTTAEALAGAVAALRGTWQARRVLAVVLPGDEAPGEHPPEPEVVGAGSGTRWVDLPDEVRAAIGEHRRGDLLTATTSGASAASIAVQHPRGVLAVWVELAEQRPFTPEDQTLLTMLAGRLGQGLARMHALDQQRETALALQHAILGPQRLPIGFAVRYQPATSPLQVGGDWYDVIDLDDGRIGLVVGDCVGHGLAAATVMGQLRSACRALLLEHPDPSAALAGMDRFASRLTGAKCTTAFCAVLDPETGELVYSGAGHPPPVVVHADSTTTTLQEASTIPLGLRPGRPRPAARVVLPPRSTLLLYTDGLVERRRSPLDEGIARAGDLVAAGRAESPEELADRLMSRLAPADGYEDDVALLLYRHPAPLHMDLTADAEDIAPARGALRGWLNRCGLDPVQVQNILVAAGEAVTNAIEHGHRESPGGRVLLRAAALIDALHITVTDTGSWKLPNPQQNPHRGRGITLMRALMNDVTIESDTTGTTVHLHTRIA